MGKRRIAFVAGVVVLLFLFLSFAFSWYVSRTGAYIAGAGETVSRTLEESLGVPVTVGGVRIYSTHGLSLEDVRIFDKTGTQILYAGEAKVDFSLFAVFSSSPAAAISEVTLESPEIRLQEREDGSWNAADLMQKKSESGDFRGKVLAKDGKASFAFMDRELRLTDIEAELDFDKNPTLGVMVSARNEEAVLSAEGEIADGRQEFEFKGENLGLMEYLAFLPKDKVPQDITPEAGLVNDLRLKVLRGDGNLSLSGEVRFSGGQAVVYGTRVEAMDGLLLFSGEEARVFLRAEAKGQKASVHGRVAWQDEQPSFNFVAESAAFDPSAIFAQSPYEGAVHFLASVYGTEDDYKIDGECDAAEGIVYGCGIRDAKAKVHYESGLLTARLASKVLGGTASGDVAFHTGDGSYEAHVEGQDFAGEELSALMAVDGLSLSGRYRADVVLQGKGQDEDSLLVYGTLAGDGASYKGVAANSLAASFFKQGERLHLDYLGMEFASGGSLGVEGDIDGASSLDLLFYGTALPLETVRLFAPDVDAAGSLDLSGTVRGAMDNPLIQASFSASDGRLLQQPFTALYGSVSGSLERIDIEEFVLERNGKMTWLAEGTVGLVGERPINLRVDSVGARMEDLAAVFAPDQPITGNVDNTIRFTGTLDNPSAVGYIHFYRGSYDGYILSGMDGDYYLEGDTVRLQDFHIFSPLVDMDVNGTVTRGGALDLYAAAHDISLDRVGSKLPYPVSGNGTFDGHISGTLAAPRFDGVLDAKRLTLNGQEIEEVHGEVRLSDNVLRAEKFGFRQNDGTYTMRAMANLDTQALDGDVQVKNGDVRAILAVANLKSDIIEGRLDGEIRFAGTLENPDAELTATVTDGKVSGYEIRDLKANLRLADHVVTIRELMGRQGNGLFAAEGRVPLEESGGNLDARFSATDIAAGMVTKSLGIAADVKGAINLEVQTGGTIKNPTANASVEIKNGGVGASTFDSLTGLFNLRNGVIHVDQLFVRKTLGERRYSASAKGDIPLKSLTASSEEWLDVPEQLSLTVSLDQADLSLLPILSPSVDWALGPTQGEVRVTGTLAHPYFSGEISLSEGALKFKQLERPITEMKARLRFSGSEISLTECTGKMGGGSYSVTGAARFQNGRFEDYALDIKADELGVVSSFYNGPLTGELRLSEGMLHGRSLPKLTGEIHVHHTTLAIPSLPEEESVLPEVILDVGVTLGEKVRFYSPSLYDMRLAGGFHYGGTTRYVAPSGSVTVERGTITYNRTRFTVKEGEAYFNQVGSFLPSLILEAEARFGKTRIFLHTTGPIGKMETHLTSEPAMSETEILRLLTFRTTDVTNEKALTALLNFGLSMTILGDIENNVRNALGLDEFRIDGEEVDEFHKRGIDDHRMEYNLQIGKYINDRVMLRYKQGIGNKTREYGISYDFTDRVSAYYNYDEESRNVFGLEARIRF